MKNKLCTKCILPDNYVGISFDDDGVCNFCNERKDHQYLGKEKLKEEINSIFLKYPDRKYDCVVGLSGGRDSTYLLWYVVNEMNINPIISSLARFSCRNEANEGGR